MWRLGLSLPPTFPSSLLPFLPGSGRLDVLLLSTSWFVCCEEGRVQSITLFYKYKHNGAYWQRATATLINIAQSEEVTSPRLWGQGIRVWISFEPSLFTSYSSLWWEETTVTKFHIKKQQISIMNMFSRIQRRVTLKQCTLRSYVFRNRWVWGKTLSQNNGRGLLWNQNHETLSKHW